MKEPRAKVEVGPVPPEVTNRRRSQRVMLQIAVLIRAELPDGSPVQVQALTLVVNAHGGLLKSPLMLTVSQKIMLGNPQTGREVRCRVVRTERSSSEMVTTAFEFDEPTTRFWPISFPPEDWKEFAS